MSAVQSYYSVVSRKSIAMFCSEVSLIIFLVDRFCLDMSQVSDMYDELA